MTAVAGVTAGVPAIGLWLLALSGGATLAMIVAVLAVRASTTVRCARRAGRRAVAAPLLLAVLDGERVDPPRDRGVADALGELGTEMVHKLRGADREALAEWLAGAGYWERALVLLGSRRPARRARGVDLYLAVGSGLDPGPVVARLADRHRGVRLAAARALGAAGAAGAVGPLAASAGARRPVPVGVAAMAVVNAAPSSAEQLADAWRSPDVRVRGLAVDVAGHLGLADARGRLERALADEALCGRAAAALARIGSPESVPALTAALDGLPPSSPHRAAVRFALAALGADDRVLEGVPA